jgi:hypothetical protein
MMSASDVRFEISVSTCVQTRISGNGCTGIGAITLGVRAALRSQWWRAG